MSRLSDLLVTHIHMKDIPAQGSAGHNDPCFDDQAATRFQEAVRRSAYLARLQRLSSLQLSTSGENGAPALIAVLTQYASVSHKRLTRLALSGAELSTATTSACALACPQLDGLNISCQAVDQSRVWLSTDDLLLPLLALTSMTHVSP